MSRNVGKWSRVSWPVGTSAQVAVRRSAFSRRLDGYGAVRRHRVGPLSSFHAGDLEGGPGPAPVPGGRDAPGARQRLPRPGCADVAANRGTGAAAVRAGFGALRLDDCWPCRSSCLRTHSSDEGPMSKLRDILQTHVSNGSVPGAVGLIARGDRVEVQAAGSAGTRRRLSDGQELDLPHRFDHQARHSGGGDDAGPGRPGRAGRSGRTWPLELASPAVVRTPACRSMMWSRPTGRSPWPICSTFRAGTASRPTSRCPRSSCWSAS